MNVERLVKESMCMEKNAMNNQVIKAISIGLAAFIAATGPIEAQAAQSTNTDDVRLHRAAQERASAVVAGNTDIEQELATAKDTEQKLQQAFETVRLQLEAEAKSQYARALEDAKYEFDFAQSVVGEKKWDYERALYAFETAQSRYKQYKIDHWKFWQWHDSQEYQEYRNVKNTYDKLKESLEKEERKMDEAESAFGQMGSPEVVGSYVEAAVQKARNSREYHKWQNAQNEVLRLMKEQEVMA